MVTLATRYITHRRNMGYATGGAYLLFDFGRFADRVAPCQGLKTAIASSGPLRCRRCAAPRDEQRFAGPDIDATQQQLETQRHQCLRRAVMRADARPARHQQQIKIPRRHLTALTCASALSSTWRGARVTAPADLSNACTRGPNHPRLGAGVSFRQQHARVWQTAGFCAQPAAAVVCGGNIAAPTGSQLLHRRPTGRTIQAVKVAAQSGLDAMSSVETNPNERGLGKPCAGKPFARFDEGESSVAGNRFAAFSTLLKPPLEG